MKEHFSWGDQNRKGEGKGTVPGRLLDSSARLTTPSFPFFYVPDALFLLSCLNIPTKGHQAR